MISAKLIITAECDVEVSIWEQRFGEDSEFLSGKQVLGLYEDGCCEIGGGQL